MKTRQIINALLLIAGCCCFMVAAQPAQRKRQPLAANPLIKIIRYEDQRNWNDDLKALLSDRDPKIRKRAALAAGRIGDERAVPALAELLAHDQEVSVAQEAAFALGEIESAAGADALVQALDAAATTSTRAPEMSSEIRARALEALGKIAAALPETLKEKRLQYGELILKALRTEAERQPDELTAMLGLTAILRARPEGAAPVLVRFLDYQDSRVVADALNTMARLRVKDGNEKVRKLLNHTDPIVRANAARVIGAAEHKDAFDELLAQALNDSDLRVRASAIRALAALKDARAAKPLLERGKRLWATVKSSPGKHADGEVNEILEIATALGRTMPLSNDKDAIAWFDDLRQTLQPMPVEVEISYARVAPQFYQTETLTSQADGASPSVIARSQASEAQGIAELAAIKTGNAALDANIRETSIGNINSALASASQKSFVRPPKIKPGQAVVLVGSRGKPLQPMAVSDYLRAAAAHKMPNLAELLKQHIADSDVIVRATAAELIGEQPPTEENTRALVAALPRALQDKDLNDAALAILEALGKQKNAAANDAIKTALNSDDHLIRRRAVAILKANGAGDFSNRIGLVKTRYTDADYRRAIARISKKTTATVVTSRGSFTIELLSEDAPLTVDNFIQLAKRGFFNGQTIPRVVPNFVVQAGDPRGDQNGGPGYSIRCEVNEVPYKRAAVGMALSGKDTGGSQWFVTHSPQPHLDGGYTVFGRVISGMDVIDSIVRGDTIQKVSVSEK